MFIGPGESRVLDLLHAHEVLSIGLCSKSTKFVRYPDSFHSVRPQIRNSPGACRLFTKRYLPKTEKPFLVSMGPARVELAISGLGNRCSILLSYEPVSAPDGSQTRDLWLRRPTLYSTELQAHALPTFYIITTKTQDYFRSCQSFFVNILFLY